MKFSLFRTLFYFTLTLSTSTLFARAPWKLGANQTEGFGAGKLLRFTYTESFACVDQPNDDLNFNKVKADRDPGEMQTPIQERERQRFKRLRECKTCLTCV